jgi:coronin-1B/1C/6
VGGREGERVGEEEGRGEYEWCVNERKWGLWVCRALSHTWHCAAHTQIADRELKVWDPRGDVSKPLNATELDQAAGVIMPFYDEDTRMLYLAGKGDGNIRYYEMVDGEPYVYPLAEYRTNVSTKGADCLPKRACNAMKCEVARFLKLTNDTVEPVSMIVPRKEQSFQEVRRRRRERFRGEGAAWRA